MALWIARDSAPDAMNVTCLFFDKPKPERNILDDGVEWATGGRYFVLDKHYGLKPGDGPVRVKIVRKDGK